MRRVLPAFGLSLLCALPAGAAIDLGTEQQREAGKQLYDKYCSQCHGAAGDGQGHATPRVNPRPRDFTSAKYKFRTTPSGRLPTDADLRKVIVEGLPYTSMPGWPQLTERQVQEIIYYLKTFSPAFENPEMHGEPIEIPEAPPITEESVARGRTVYEQQGCAACHGDLGRGNGPSSPTLKDDFGNPLRPADMTMRWTFRGGPTREDIFRTFSTGVNGTPMPSYADSLAVEDRWDLVNYIYSLGDGDDPDYATLLVAPFVDDELDLENAELFDAAARARFPLVGQIMEPGRNFYPLATSVEVQAVYNRTEIAFRVRWHDMSAETSGSNDPTLAVPAWDEEHPVTDGGDEADGGGFWGEEVDETEGAGAEDFWGEEEGEEDFWGEEEEGAGAGSGFSDAVALQLPSQLPTGNRKPYFLFGDAQSPVDLWFVDLAQERVQQFIGRGSSALEPSETDEFESRAHYDNGRWEVLIKRSLRSADTISFQERQFVPIAFSVWNGREDERGNKRAVSAWFYFYVEPQLRVSAAGPMLKATLATLLVEILFVFIIRRRFAARPQEGGGLSPLPAE